MTNNIKYIQPTQNDHLLCVNISKTFDNNEREDIYDCARHYWRLSVNRAEKANYAAIKNLRKMQKKIGLIPR